MNENIINKWMMYAANYQLERFDENGQKEPLLAPDIIKSSHCPYHLATKWTDIAGSKNSGTNALLHLWYKLDGQNKELFTNWLIENYKL
jgi:hypothetical protein